MKLGMKMNTDFVKQKPGCRTVGRHHMLSLGNANGGTSKRSVGTAFDKRDPITRVAKERKCPRNWTERSGSEISNR